MMAPHPPKGRQALTARLTASARLRSLAGLRGGVLPVLARYPLWLNGAPADEAALRGWMDGLDLRQLRQLAHVAQQIADADDRQRRSLAVEALVSRYIPGAPLDRNLTLFEAERYYARRALIDDDQARIRATFEGYPGPRPLPPVALPPALVERARSARRVSWILGAGISVGAGIPSYRGEGGIYPVADVRQMATLPAWLSHPDRIWAHFNFVKDWASTRAPTPAHRAIARLGQRFEQNAVITQNIDGMERRCGIAPIALHGRLDRYRCLNEEADKPAPDRAWNDRSFPICPDCGALLKPGVVFFFEGIPGADFDRALDAIAASDLVFEVGTSHAVKPASNLWRYARRNGADVVIVNPSTSTREDEVAFLLRGDCQQILPALADALSGTRS